MLPQQWPVVTTTRCRRRGGRGQAYSWGQAGWTWPTRSGTSCTATQSWTAAGPSSAGAPELICSVCMHFKLKYPCSAIRFFEN